MLAAPGGRIFLVTGDPILPKGVAGRGRRRQGGPKGHGERQVGAGRWEMPCKQGGKGRNNRAGGSRMWRWRERRERQRRGTDTQGGGQRCRGQGGRFFASVTPCREASGSRSGIGEGAAGPPLVCRGSGGRQTNLELLRPLAALLEAARAARRALLIREERRPLRLRCCPCSALPCVVSASFPPSSCLLRLPGRPLPTAET